uniref:Aminotransferase n=1 Tax=Acidicaldus sp. TaxID=1872105 RepID=A0A8J4HA08_9PROT
MPRLAARLERLPPAATVAMTQRARALREAGVRVLTLSIGEPDFPTPPHAIAAAHEAALRGETKYPPQDGTRALKVAVQRKFRRDSGLDYALDEIMVANGGKQVIFNALMAAVDPGSEVIIPAPYWASYTLLTELAQGVVVPVNCPQNSGFRLRPEDLAQAITPRTRLVLLNFPNNPTGAACSRAEMAALGKVLLEHPDIWVLCDDMYEHLIYDGFEYVTMAAAEPRLRARVLTVSGVSKTYAMTGWRIGFCGGPRELIRAMVNIQGQATAGVSTIGQAAAAAALDGPQELIAERAAIYRARRDLLVDLLNAAPGISCHKPEGAFYVFPNIAGCLGRRSAGGRMIASDADFAAALLEEQHVAVVQGAAFGMSPYLRISYAAEPAVLEEAGARIIAFCAALH